MGQDAEIKAVAAEAFQRSPQKPLERLIRHTKGQAAALEELQRVLQHVLAQSYEAATPAQPRSEKDSSEEEKG